MTNRFSLPPDSIAVPAPLPDNLGAVRFANRATELTIPLLAAIAIDRALVYVDDGTVSEIREAHEAATTISRRIAVYGRTTGVGANRTVDVDANDPDHGMRILRSHAADAGAPVPSRAVRGMLAVRLRQLCVPGSGIRPDVLTGLATMLNDDALPEVRTFGSVGTGDLAALAGTALTLVGEREASRPVRPLPQFGADSALAFISSSALTLARAALALHNLEALERSSAHIFALTARAINANPEHWSPAAAAATSSTGTEAVTAAIRRALPNPECAARIQDPYGIRAYPHVHGTFHDARRRVADLVTALMNTAQENPLFLFKGEGSAVHHAASFQAGLAQSIDALTLALANTMPLTTARIRMLSEPSYTGRQPFLSSPHAGASGVLIVEYIAAAAGAELRTSATPASLGTVVLSRGMEEDAPFATQSVTHLERAVDALRITFGCELLVAVRTLRQQGKWDAVKDQPGLRQLDRALPSGDDDRDLRMELKVSIDLAASIGNESRMGTDHS